MANISKWLYAAASSLMLSAQLAYEDATELAKRDMAIGSRCFGAIGSAKEWLACLLGSIAMRFDIADENDGL